MKRGCRVNADDPTLVVLTNTRPLLTVRNGLMRTGSELHRLACVSVNAYSQGDIIMLRRVLGCRENKLIVQPQLRPFTQVINHAMQSAALACS